jgi:hypothetical protein
MIRERLDVFMFTLPPLPSRIQKHTVVEKETSEATPPQIVSVKCL